MLCTNNCFVFYSTFNTNLCEISGRAVREMRPRISTIHRTSWTTQHLLDTQWSGRNCNYVSNDEKKAVAYRYQSCETNLEIPLKHHWRPSMEASHFSGANVTVANARHSRLRRTLINGLPMSHDGDARCVGRTSNESCHPCTIKTSHFRRGTESLRKIPYAYSPSSFWIHLLTHVRTLEDMPGWTNI